MTPRKYCGTWGDSPQNAFAVQLVQRLPDQGESVAPALAWLARALRAQGTTPAEAVAREHRAQRAANATVRNIITGMHWMSSIAWLEFFESVSLVDAELRASVSYPAMDFETRDEYRRQVEILSRGSGQSEIEIARGAVVLDNGAIEPRFRTAPHEPTSGQPDEVMQFFEVPSQAQADPGYYLLASGRRSFERRLGFRAPFRVRVQRACRARALAGYLGGVAALIALQLVGLLFIAQVGGSGAPTLVLLAVLGLIPASDIAISLVQRLVAALFPPSRLPKLDLPLACHPNSEQSW